MNQFDHQWRKLTALARQAGDSREVAAPYGFATRVASRAGAISPGPSWAPIELYALRGLIVAATCGVTAVAFSFSGFTTSTLTDAYVAADAASELLDFS